MDRYIDPNSGAAPQPGGYSGRPPVDPAGNFDAAVADDVTEEQEKAELEQEAAERAAAKSSPAKKAPAKSAAKKAPAKKAAKSSSRS